MSLYLWKIRLKWGVVILGFIAFTLITLWGSALAEDKAKPVAESTLMPSSFLDQSTFKVLSEGTAPLGGDEDVAETSMILYPTTDNSSLLMQKPELPSESNFLPSDEGEIINESEEPPPASFDEAVSENNSRNTFERDNFLGSLAENPTVDMDNDFGNFSGIPVIRASQLFAAYWEPDTEVVISQGNHLDFFSNIYGTKLMTNEYFLLGSGEVAYCADQEALPPEDTVYNGSVLDDENYMKSITAVILAGYPYETRGLSALDARYATATAIHWLENYWFGNTEGWNYQIRQQTSAPGHEAALAMALDLFEIGVTQKVPACTLQLAVGSSWSKNVESGELEIQVAVSETETACWTLAAPAGTGFNTPEGLKTSYTGVGNQSLTLILASLADFQAGSKRISGIPQTDRDRSNVRIFAANGNFQVMAAVKPTIIDQAPITELLPNSYGSFRIHKQYKDYQEGVFPEAEALYQVWSKSESNSFTEAQTRWEIKTDKNGYSPIISDVPPGEYYLKQIASGATTEGNNIITVDIQTHTLTVLPEERTDKSFTNLLMGSLVIEKWLLTAEGTRIVEVGADFEIWHQSFDTFEAAKLAGHGYQLTTNAKGEIRLDYLPLAGAYFIRQTGSADEAISIHSKIETIICATGNISKITLENKERTGYFEIAKLADWTHELSMPEEEVVFQLYRLPVDKADAFDPLDYDRAAVLQRAELITDTGGKAISGPLLLGRYIVRQITTTPSHKKVADFVIEIQEENQVVTRSITNEPITGKIHIRKYRTEADETGTLLPEAGAEFAIYPAKYADWSAAKSELVEGSSTFYAFTDYLISDEFGELYSEPMPYGTYRIEQIVAPDPNYALVLPWIVEITQDQQVYEYLRNDRKIPFYLQLLKSDQETKIPVSQAKFQLYQSADSQGEFKAPKQITLGEQESWSTDVNGIISWDNLPLEIGEYYLLEVEAPSGYMKIEAPINFSITGWADDRTFVLNNHFVKRIEVENEPIKLIVEIKKRDSFNQMDLEGALFHVIDSKNALIAAIITDKKGEGKSPPLPWDNYSIVEISAPSGYITDTNVYPIPLEGLSSSGALRVFRFESINQPTEFQILKMDASTGQPLPGANFILKNTEGKVISFSKQGEVWFADPEGGETELISNQEGLISCLRLPVGTYYIEESLAPRGYLLDDEAKLLEINNESQRQNPIIQFQNKPKTVLVKTGERENVFLSLMCMIVGFILLISYLWLPPKFLAVSFSLFLKKNRHL